MPAACLLSQGFAAVDGGGDPLYNLYTDQLSAARAGAGADDFYKDRLIGERRFGKSFIASTDSWCAHRSHNYPY